MKKTIFARLAILAVLSIAAASPLAADSWPWPPCWPNCEIGR